MKSNPYLETFTRVAQYKAHRLIRLSRVHKVNDSEYLVLPILGYNSTTYKIKPIMGKLTCTCQRGRKDAHCTHALAVFLFIEQTDGIKDRQLQFC